MDAQPFCHEIFEAPPVLEGLDVPLEILPETFFSSHHPTSVVTSTRRSPKKPKTSTSIGDAQGAATRSKKAQPKYRNWVFTINNPPVDANGVVVPPQPLLWSRHVFSIWQLERGENGTLHWQGYVEFSGQFSLSQLKNGCQELRTAHLEGRRGSADQAVSYCRPEKGGTVRDPTVVSEVPLEFGERKQVICYNCYCWIYRRIQFLANSIGFFRDSYDEIVCQKYECPLFDEYRGGQGLGGLYVPCPCVVAVNHLVRFPPKLRLDFVNGSYII